MKDAVKALQISPGNIKALVARGEAFYSLGEFERGLVRDGVCVCVFCEL